MREATISELVALAGQEFLWAQTVLFAEELIRLRAAGGQLAALLKELQPGLARELWFEIDCLNYIPDSVRERQAKERLVELLGDGEKVRAYFGERAGRLYEEMVSNLNDLADYEKWPPKQWLQDRVANALAERKTVRILCPRWAEESIIRALSSVFTEERSRTIRESLLFARRLREYRDVRTFDVLFRIGPMRTHGLGWVPDAVLTAPRFRMLEQFLWEGVENEEALGYDACGEWDRDSVRMVMKPQNIRWRVRRHVQTACKAGDAPLKTVVTRREEVVGGVEWSDLMEGEQEWGGVINEVVILVLAGGKAAIFRPGSDVMWVDPRGRVILQRSEASRVPKGKWLARASVEEPGLRGGRKTRYERARVWKRRLAEILREDRATLLGRLRKAGIGVQNLEAQVYVWARMDEQLMLAPRKRRDRRILLEVLGFVEERGSRWVEEALREISEAHGNAVREGMIVKAILDEAVQQEIEGRSDEIRELLLGAASRGVAEVELRKAKGVGGYVEFYRIDDVNQYGDDEALALPESRVNVVIPLGELDMYLGIRRRGSTCG